MISRTRLKGKTYQPGTRSAEARSDDLKSTTAASDDSVAAAKGLRDRTPPAVSIVGSQSLPARAATMADISPSKEPFCVPGPPNSCSERGPSGLSADETRAYEQLKVLFAKRRAYAQMMGTRPQTVYGLADSPVGLAAWLFDHGDGYDQPSAALTSAVLGRTTNGHPAGDLTRNDVLDDFTLYWLTNTAISAARFYWELHFSLYNAANVAIPAAVSVFPGENYQAPRTWTERAYPKLIYFNEVDKGGHFAAWEQPQLFAEEIRAAFRSLRQSGDGPELGLLVMAPVLNPD